MQKQNQFDAYTDDVNRRLKFLSAEERAENLLEIRQHLQTALETRLEAGEAEELATGDVLMQFGPARSISGRSVNTYLRRRLNRLRYSWFGAVVGIVAAGFLLAIVDSIFLPTLSRMVPDDSVVQMAVLTVSMFARCLCFGWLISWFAGRRSIPVMAIGWVLFYFVFISPQLRHEDMPMSIRVQTVLDFAGLVLSCALGTLVSLRRASRIRT